MDSLPLGFRFRPTDEELIDHYLRHKINGRHSEVEVIPEVDICKWEPWDLPRLSVIKSNDPEWFFFCPLDRKYPNRHRTNRATDTGYWKATGKDRTVKSRKSSKSGCSTTHLIGTKKTLVFYKGRAPKGERTHYIMHEYRATQPDLDGTSPGQTAYVLCRLFRKHNEKAEDSDYNDAIGNHAYPTEDKCSPDQVSSDLYHEPSFQETPAARQPERRLTSERDDRTCNGYRHVTSFVSDDDDHSVHAAATEVQGIPRSDGTRYFLQSPYGTNIGCADSPFTDDFGSNQNGLLFQDGTSEQDASLSELLDILHNHDNHLSGESTAKKSCDVGSKELMSDSGSGNFLAQGTLSCSDSKMVEGQVGLLSQSSSQVEVYSYDAVSKMSNIRMLSERYNETHSASFNAPLAPCNPAQSCADNVSVSHDNSPEFGTGIKIRKRQHQQPQHQPSHEYLAAQGDAERRIHLQLEKSPNYTSSAESSEGSNFSNREELDGELNITEVCDSCSIEGGEEEEVECRNSNGRRGSRRKYGGNSKKKGKKAYLFRWWWCSPSQQSSEAKLSKVCYYVCLNLVFVLLVIVSVNIWECPKFGALRIL